MNTFPSLVVTEISTEDLIAELRRRGLAVNAWSAEDVRARLTDTNVPDSEHDAILDSVQRDRLLSVMEDCTEEDWMMLDCVIATAAERIRHGL